MSNGNVEGMDLAQIASEMEASKALLPMPEQTKEFIKQGATLEVHPTAEKFPLMADEDPDGFALLKENIIEQGEVFESIKIGPTGVLYDGRNRVRAIMDLINDGIEVRYSVEVIHPVDVKDWIISTNLHRRHLSDSQRAYIAAEMAQDGDIQLKEAAKMLGVPERSAKRANAVVKHADEETKKAVKSGKKKVATAVRETTGKSQGSKTKAQYQKDAAPATGEAPATTEKKPPKKRAPKKGAGVSEDAMEIVKGHVGFMSIRQLEDFHSYVRGALKAAKKKAV